jgi:hypothetical protein
MFEHTLARYRDVVVRLHALPSVWLSEQVFLKVRAPDAARQEAGEACGFSPRQIPAQFQNPIEDGSLLWPGTKDWIACPARGVTGNAVHRAPSKLALAPNRRIGDQTGGSADVRASTSRAGLREVGVASQSTPIPKARDYFRINRSPG